MPQARQLIRLTGVLLGVLVVSLFGGMAYESGWTNYVADKKAQQSAQRLEQAWREGYRAVRTSGYVPHGTSQAYADVFALMYIPRLASQVWETPVSEGVSASQLDMGIGHYPGTALPGELGNFAVAGHRATHGEPFANFDSLERGDRVYVRTRTHWYTYVLLTDRKISPKATWILDAQPKHLSTYWQSPLITLVTCDPRWGSARRWAWWGTLVAAHPTGKLPPEVALQYR